MTDTPDDRTVPDDLPPDEADFPEHAFEEDETVFTGEDDRNAPPLAVPDEQIVALAGDKGIDDLIDIGMRAQDG